MGEHGDDYRFPFNAFLSNAHDLLDAEVKDALRSGVFNGEILGKQVRLHSGRRAFVQDDALVEFCIGVTEWFNKIGRRYYAEAKDKKREERWQTTGLKALDALHAMLKLQDYAYLRNVLDTFSFGSHGAGHAPTGTTPSGQKADKVIAKGSGKGSGKGSHPSEPPAKDNPNHKPFTVAGPRGSQRRRVAHDSLGLTITFYGRDSDDLWDLDLREGTLNFNERHPHFRACEKREWQLHRLIHFVVIQALTLETLPNDNGLMRLAYNELIGPYVFMITNGPELANASAKDQSA